MKKIFFTFAIIYCLFITTSQLYSQSGWLPQTSGTTNILWSAAFADSLTGWSVGGSTGSATIVKTTNGGINWFQQTSPVTTGLNACKFVNSNSGWIVTESGSVLKTTNGGSFWANISTGFGSPLFCISFLDENIGWVGGQIGVILKTTNGGMNWIVINAASSTILFSGIHFTNSLTGYAVGGTLPSTGAVYKSTNGGLNWFSLNIGSISVCEEVFFINDQTGWVSANSGVVKGTTNGGASWTQYNVGYASYNVFDLYFLNTYTGWACGGSYSGSTSAGFIVKTTNSGTNWNSQLNGPMITALDFVSSNIAYGVGFGGSIYKTTTSGETVPLAPTLLSPANNSTNVGLTPTLFWNTVSNATSYKVIISSMINFGNIIDSATVTTNQRTIPNGKLNVASTYYWKVLANNQYGSSPWSEAWNFSTVLTGITLINSELPSSFKIVQNHPNPFNPVTNIRFEIPKSSFVKISVYDLTGKEIEILVNQNLKPGVYETNWNASIYSSGIYFCKITAGEFTQTKKMVLLK